MTTDQEILTELAELRQDEPPLLRTATVPLEIACPAWCDEHPEFHLSQLADLEARCIHLMPSGVIEDEEGFRPWGADQARYSPSVDVHMSVVTDLRGKETEPPVLFLNGHDLTIPQALALADEIRRQVELYRSSGGIS